ncbi:MAG: GNAT family N-acetyltransferase [Candidatus Hodarchaeales archaeon]|jgi:ribosomal protein S18 acetylase RimI-like enzyme
MLDKETIRTVQERANNIWPTESFYLINGWILRVNKGVTWRANSVLPLNYWGNNILQDIAKVEDIYLKFKSSSKFMLHDKHAPSELCTILNELSYKPVLPTDVMGIHLSEIEIENVNHSFSYNYKTHRDPEWYTALTRLSPNRSPYKMKVIGEIIDRVTIPQKRFFYAHIDSKIIGVVLVIIDDNYMGIMNLAVDPKYRNKGVATNLLWHTIEWAKRNNTEYIFLQVEKTNTSAKNLYDKLGLKEWYSYTYYEKDIVSD